MLSISNVSKSYDSTKILNNISFSLINSEKVGLVGKNGCGKSTLLRIINSKFLSDSGVINVTGKIAYLPQHIEFTEKTIGGFLNNSLDDYGNDYKITILLQEFGIDYLDLNKDPNSLSGGEKTKLYFISFFITQVAPNILLLDEPTNNLDLQALSLLEAFITKFNGIVLLVSHDRYFLDRVCTKIIEIEHGSASIYGGNYSFYKNQKQLENNAKLKNYIAQKKKISKALSDINNYTNKALWGERKFTSGNPYERKKAAKAAKQAIVRKKKLIKFIESNEYVPKPKYTKSFYLPLKNNILKSQMVLNVSNLTVAVEGKELIKNTNLTVYGGEHIWINGKNGSGKTSFLKNLKSQNTKVTLGTNVVIGSINQDFDLNISLSAVNYLTEFGIPKFDIFKLAVSLRLLTNDLKVPLKNLSRGQQLKIEFIKLILGGFNLLLLDEPTNHLEVETREDIEQVLNSYSGCIVVVSHDRYFLDKIGVDRAFEINKCLLKEF